MTASLDAVEAAMGGWRHSGQPFLLGICGAQGSGKSTLATNLALRLSQRGARVAQLSIDDLYLPLERRPVTIHPLFATRGVPGTHDTALGLGLIDALLAGEAARLPRFDKASDRPLPEDQWIATPPPDIILFEGWCVGARPQPEEVLAEPVNRLEALEDPDGVWRRYANAQLAGPYAELFGRLNRLVFLQAPDFAVVKRWRTQQEYGLRYRLEREGRTGTTMSDGQVARFIRHYERLTRHIIATMPAYADLTLRLDARRRLIAS